MVGGCCGSKPPHNRAISEVAKNYSPRKLPDVVRPKMWLSGLVNVVVDDVHNHLGFPFLDVGERCNISGSIRFKKLMMKGDYAKAMYFAKKQVEDGAHKPSQMISNVLFVLDAFKFEIVMA